MVDPHESSSGHGNVLPGELPPNESGMEEEGARVAIEKLAGGQKKIGSNRGIETLFRCVYGVHVNLTTLADSKANFLISVNTLVMLIVVVHGVAYVDHKLLFLPVCVVLCACMGSIIFAVLSARPRIAKEGSSDSRNLLFFGHYTQLPKEQFMSEFDEMLRDRPKIYSHMSGDLYEIGKVLSRKYRLLRYAYWFLLYGLPAGTVLFLVLWMLLLSEKI